MNTKRVLGLVAVLALVVFAVLAAGINDQADQQQKAEVERAQLDYQQSVDGMKKDLEDMKGITTPIHGTGK